MTANKYRTQHASAQPQPRPQAKPSRKSRQAQPNAQAPRSHSVYNRGPAPSLHNDEASAMARRVIHPDLPSREHSSRPIVLQRWQSGPGPGTGSGQRIRISIGEENALYYYNRIKPLTLNSFFNFEELDCKAAAGKGKTPSKKTPGGSRTVPTSCTRSGNQSRIHPGNYFHGAREHFLPSSSVSLPLIFGLLIDGHTWGGGGCAGGGSVQIWHNKVHFKLDQQEASDQCELKLKPVGFETQNVRRRNAMAARQNGTMDQSQSVYFIFNISLGGPENGPSHRVEQGGEQGGEHAPVWRVNYHQQPQQLVINRHPRHPPYPTYWGSQQQPGCAMPWDMNSSLGRPNANGQVPIYQVERKWEHPYRVPPNQTLDPHYSPQDPSLGIRYHGHGPPDTQPRGFNNDQWHPIQRLQHPPHHPPFEQVQHQPPQYPQHPQYTQFGQCAGQETQHLETLMEEEEEEAHMNEALKAKLMELRKMVRRSEQMLLLLQQRADFDPVVCGCCSNWNWLENGRQIEMITSLEYFPVRASQELLLGAALYALYDEHFFNLPAGWCYRGTLEPPVQMTMAYHPVYNTYHHQPPWKSWQWQWHWHQWPLQQHPNGWQQQRQQQWYWQHFYWQQERQHQWQQQQQQQQLQLQEEQQQQQQNQERIQEQQMQDQDQWRRQYIQRSRSRWNHHHHPYTNNQTSDAIMTFDAFPHGHKDALMRCRQEATASVNWKSQSQYKTLAETRASMEEPFSEPTEGILNLSTQHFPPLPKPQSRGPM